MRYTIPDQRRILDTYGVENQTMIWMEELAELSKAASKCVRNNSIETVSDLSEEIGDVLICIQQMCKAYKIPARWIQEVIWEKFERQMKRIDSEFEKGKEN